MNEQIDKILSMNEYIDRILSKESELNTIYRTIIVFRWSDDFRILNEKERELIRSLQEQIKEALNTLSDIHKLYR